MKRLPLPLPLTLSSIALAVLAACATESGITTAAPPVSVAPVSVAPVQQPYVVTPNGAVVAVPQAAGAMVVMAPSATPLRAGMGHIESIQPVAAGVGGKPSNSSRVVAKMDDGSMQYFDTAAPDMKVGDRIEITKNGTMRHPA